MKKIAILFVTLCMYASSYAQCGLSALFPVTFSESRFDVELNLRRSGLYQVPHTQPSGFWDKPNYLIGDSVYISRIETTLSDLCIYSHRVDVHFSFADDRLYGILLEAYFSAEEYEKGLVNYHSLVSEIMTTLPFYSQVNVKDGNTLEKIGEAYKFYRSDAELAANEYSTARLQFSKVRSEYILELSYKNFDAIKIDNRGYSLK